MSEATTAKFACSACGKMYTWKPQFAGKKLKCSCGQLMQAPESLDAPPSPPDLNSLYDMGPEPVKPKPKPAAPPADGPPCPVCGQSLPTPNAVLCIHCGHNLKTGKKLKTKLAKPAAAAPDTSPKNALGYFIAPPKTATDEEPVGFLSQPNTKEFHIPIALIVVGLAVTVFVGMNARSVKEIGAGMAILGIATTIDLVLILAGIFLTARLMSISFGAIGPAILKICAISLLPGAIAQLIEWQIPSGGNFIAWAVSLLCYYGLFMLLFDLDFGETMMCVALIWIIRTWIGMFLLMLIRQYLLGGL